MLRLATAMMSRERCLGTGELLRLEMNRPASNQQEEHRDEDQDVDGGSNHPTNNRGRDRPHDVRADTCLSENWREAQDYCRYCHQLGTKTLDSTIDYGLFEVGL